MKAALPIKATTIQSRITKGLRLCRVPAVLLSSSLVIAACGGGGGSSDTTANDTEEFVTNFTLNVSDAPVDFAREVIVFFDTVELIGDGEPVVIDVREEDGLPLEVDLLQLQGTAYKSIIDGIDIPSGVYTQVRIPILEQSYVVMQDGTYPLSVPSGEVKLDGFTAEVNEQQTFTVEFDLRKSLVNPVGQEEVFLKPRGIRLVDNSEAGSVEGKVDIGVVTHPDCAIKTDYTQGNAVYVFEGIGLDPDSLGDDADPSATDTEFRPIATATVNADETSDEMTYGVGYLEAGDYTLALTCLANFDDPEADDGYDFTFLTVKEVSVAANEVVTVNFDN